eukprot:IDg20625t1
MQPACSVQTSLAFVAGLRGGAEFLKTERRSAMDRASCDARTWQANSGARTRHAGQ